MEETKPIKEQIITPVKSEESNVDLDLVDFQPDAITSSPHPYPRRVCLIQTDTWLSDRVQTVETCTFAAVENGTDGFFIGTSQHHIIHRRGHRTIVQREFCRSPLRGGVFTFVFLVVIIFVLLSLYFSIVVQFIIQFVFYGIYCYLVIQIITIIIQQIVVMTTVSYFVIPRCQFFRCLRALQCCYRAFACVAVLIV